MSNFIIWWVDLTHYSLQRQFWTEFRRSSGSVCRDQPFGSNAELFLRVSSKDFWDLVYSSSLSCSCFFPSLACPPPPLPTSKLNKAMRASAIWRYSTSSPTYPSAGQYRKLGCGGVKTRSNTRLLLGQGQAGSGEWKGSLWASSFHSNSQSSGRHPGIFSPLPTSGKDKSQRIDQEE